MIKLHHILSSVELSFTWSGQIWRDIQGENGLISSKYDTRTWRKIRIFWCSQINNRNLSEATIFSILIVQINNKDLGKSEKHSIYQAVTHTTKYLIFFNLTALGSNTSPAIGLGFSVSDQVLPDFAVAALGIRKLDDALMWELLDPSSLALILLGVTFPFLECSCLALNPSFPYLWKEIILH